MSEKERGKQIEIIYNSKHECEKDNSEETANDFPHHTIDSHPSISSYQQLYCISTN
jgi:hypothetical protein